MNEQQERADFEATMKGVVVGPWMFDAREGKYSFAGMRLAWMAWKARAALAAQGVPADPCMVLWEAMNEAERVGNRSDDKLVVEFLRRAGYAITSIAGLATRSQRMAAAGFTARDRRLPCDECGKLFSVQMLPVHKCEPVLTPVGVKQADVFAHEAPTAPAPERLAASTSYAPHWQGGLTNEELLHWFGLKAKADPTGRDLSCFALGVEVGCGTGLAPKPGAALAELAATPAQAQQASDWTDVRMELEAAGRDDLSRFVESATEPAQAQQADPLTGEQRHEIRGTGGIDVLELADQWAANKVTTYQLVNEAEKIIDAAVDRALGIGASSGSES